MRLSDIIPRVRSDCWRKRGYRSARTAGAIAAKRRRAGAPMLRTYECPWCGQWHLTKDVGPKVKGRAPRP